MTSSSISLPFERSLLCSPLKLLCESDTWSDCDSRPGELLSEPVSKSSSEMDENDKPQNPVSQDGKLNLVPTTPTLPTSPGSELMDADADKDIFDTLLASSPKVHRTPSPLSRGSRSISDISFECESPTRPESPTTLLSVSPVSLDSAGLPKKQTKQKVSLPFRFGVDPPTSHVNTFPLQDSFLLFMEPGPVAPPSYDIMPPGGCPRFHVYDKLEAHERLPSYEPAVYKLGICARKLEWYSPHEASPTRSWKNFLIELNSTQLNFYLIPSQLEPILLNSRYYTEDSQALRSYSIPKDLKSLFTTDSDMSFHGLCEQHGILPTSDCGPSSRSLSTALLSRLNPSVSKRLVRSYSLQHAKLGLASDYTKRSNVLRLRLENEQLLILFGTPKEMIQWNLGISLGRDLSLDLIDREMPRYRTVPRRRRNNIDRTTPFFNDVVARRSRAQSDPNASISLRERFFKLKGKLSSSSNSLMEVSGEEEEASQVRGRPSRLYTTGGVYCSSGSSSTNSSTTRFEQPKPRLTEGPSSNLPTISGATRYNSTSLDEDLDEDIQNMSDLHNSDDEDDLEGYMEIFANSSDRNTGTASKPVSAPITPVEDDYKWYPVKQIDTEKRILRDSLKCIRPLTFDDSWLNKTLVKPTTISPLTLAYMRESYFVTAVQEGGWPRSRSSSSASLFSGSDKYKRRNLIGKDTLLNLPDAALLKLPHHNLREYLVGPHSLTPKYL